MVPRWSLCAALVLTACTQGTQGPVFDGVIQDGTAVTPIFEKPEGYPYPLGTLAGTIGPGGLALKSYDYSVGAIDPAVWVQDFNGFTFRATFERADDPEAPGPRLTLTADLPAPLSAGMIFGAAVELAQKKGRQETVQLRSLAPATVTITGFTEGGSGSYDRITGTVTGTLCAPSGSSCVPMTLRFETGVYQNDW